MSNRKRDIRMVFWVSRKEKELILNRMAHAGVDNLSAYLRKMAIDGYNLHLEVPEIKELVSLMRYTANNINQLAKRVNAGGRLYETDVADIQQRQEQLWDGISGIISALAKVKL